MAREKIDGVIEAVRYGRNSRILWVRAFERRGAVWSDHLLLDRKTLLQRLQDGKRFVTGRRKPLLGGTFEIGQPVRVFGKAGEELISSAGRTSGGDRLDLLPIL